MYTRPLTLTYLALPRLAPPPHTLTCLGLLRLAPPPFAPLALPLKYLYVHTPPHTNQSRLTPLSPAPSCTSSPAPSHTNLPRLTPLSPAPFCTSSLAVKVLEVCVLLVKVFVVKLGQLPDEQVKPAQM